MLPSGLKRQVSMIEAREEHPRQISKSELAGGPFRLGSNYELTPRMGRFNGSVLSPFLIDKYSVTNQEFMTFVDDTGYVTEAEEIGWSFVFGGSVSDDFEDRGVRSTLVATGLWRDLEISQGPVAMRKLNHPAVQISWNDACPMRIGVKLPTEAEWEYLMTQGPRTIFPWGNQLTQMVST